MKQFDLKEGDFLYVNKDCVNCGRFRVERLDNGDEVCEKCDWNHNINDYNNTLQKELNEALEELSEFFT